MATQICPTTAHYYMQSGRAGGGRRWWWWECYYIEPHLSSDREACTDCSLAETWITPDTGRTKRVQHLLIGGGPAGSGGRKGAQRTTETRSAPVLLLWRGQNGGAEDVVSAPVAECP